MNEHIHTFYVRTHIYVGEPPTLFANPGIVDLLLRQSNMYLEGRSRQFFDQFLQLSETPSEIQNDKRLRDMVCVELLLL